MQFLEDATGPEEAFPAFCLIEPSYYGVAENDDHPPHDVMKAQKLLADVYSLIRANPSLWSSTLLVVLYDEHGGFYDHVEPPPAVPPSPPQPDWEYRFDHLGIRVPALLVSPWVRRGFDTSLLKYLIEKWGLGPLGDRAAQTNSISSLITEAQPRQDTVETIALTREQLMPPDPDLEEEAAAYISAHHKALVLVGQRLRRELLMELPLSSAWLTYLGEELLHWLFGLGNRWVFRLAHKRLKASWQEFRHRRKRQAVHQLIPVIRHPETPAWQRHLAAEALGMAVGQPFHHEPQPAQAAVAWLDRKGL